MAHRDPEAGAPTFIWLDQQPRQGDATSVAWRVLRGLPTPTASMKPRSPPPACKSYDIGDGAIVARFEQRWRA